MKPFARAVTTIALTLAGASLLAAQSAPQGGAVRPARSPSQELLAFWNDVHHKLIAMAEDMPEDKYDFKVQKDQRSFAENLLHTVGADYEVMNAMTGMHDGPEGGENPPRTTYKTKADVVKWVKQVTADGAALIKQQGDAGLNKEIRSPYGPQMVHIGYQWWGDLEHDGEHYGQLVVYYRANNMVPPESRPQPK